MRNPHLQVGRRDRLYMLVWSPLPPFPRAGLTWWPRGVTYGYSHVQVS